MLSPEQIQLARRIIGLRGTCYKARGNGWTIKSDNDRPVLSTLVDQGIACHIKGGYYVLTQSGIQQLKLQIGEFSL